MAMKQRSERLEKVVDSVADALVECMVAGFWYGVEVRAQIYEGSGRAKGPFATR
jgi:hypothetical protein